MEIDIRQRKLGEIFGSESRTVFLDHTGRPVRQRPIQTACFKILTVSENVGHATTQVYKPTNQITACGASTLAQAFLLHFQNMDDTSGLLFSLVYIVMARFTWLNLSRPQIDIAQSNTDCDRDCIYC